MSDPKRLLGGLATDTLTEAERRELLRAALDDQEVFDSLVEEEGLRELLGAPGARAQVLEALERPTGWERFRSWLTRPAIIADVVIVAGVVVLTAVGLRLYRSIEAPDRGRVAARPSKEVAASILARLDALPARQPRPAGLEMDGGTPSPVEPGALLTLRATLRGPARVLVIASEPGGAATQVFPAAGEPPLLVDAPPGGGPAIRRFTVSASSRPGGHRLRLVAAPMDVLLQAVSPADLDRLADRLCLVDLTYEVTPS